MAGKRLIGLLTVRDGGLVKSYRYEQWRPAGRLASALRNLDRWALDEIVVLDISRRAGLDPAVLREIAAAKVSTPLAYGGGIRTVSDVARLLELGCDRFVLESVLFGATDVVPKIAEITGRQALIGSLPLRLEGGSVWRWRATGEARRAGTYEPLSLWREVLLDSPVSEFLVTSVPTQGHAGRFPIALLDALDWLPAGSVIAHGGLDFASAEAALVHPRTTAVAFGNPNHEVELLAAGFRSCVSRSEAPPLRAVHLA